MAQININLKDFRGDLKFLSNVIYIGMKAAKITVSIFARLIIFEIKIV